jgi:hypothetical protein
MAGKTGELTKKAETALSKLETAGTAYEAANKQREKALADLKKAIVAADKAGAPKGAVVAASKTTRTTVHLAIKAAQEV